MHNKNAQILSIYFRYYNILNKYICAFLGLVKAQCNCSYYFSVHWARLSCPS